MRLVLAVLALALAAAPVAARAAVVNDETAHCASLGAKRPGTEADRAMAGHLEQRFRAAGLETSTEAFHLPVFTVRAQSVAVTAPRPLEVKGETFAYGGAGTVEAEVVDVGTGRASDYNGVEARGKIVLVDRNEAYHRSSQLTEVINHGGAAMLYVSGSPDNLVQTGAVRFAQDLPAPILAMTVGADDGRAIRALADEGALRMRLHVDATREDAVGRNVLGVRRGTTHPDRYVVVGAHYDSWYGGAVDNCAGVGSLLQVLDETKAEPSPYTVVFAGWDAEEVGLVGSYDWVMRHPGLVAQTVLNENLEMTSAATYVGEGRLDASLVNVMFGTTSPAMNALVYEAASRNAFTPAPSTAAGVRSISGGIIPTDLQPFYTAGVQGFSTFSSTPYYHTTEDGPDKIDAASHVRVTQYLTDVLRDVGSVPPEGLMQREVPVVAVKAPERAAPGAAVPVEITVTDPTGQPISDAAVKLLANQRDHWAVAAGRAEPLGEGRYRWLLPEGSTEAGRTAITATVDPQAYAAQGYAFVDQPAPAGAGGGSPRACAASDGLSIARATRAGRGLRLELRAAGPGVGTVDVFQQSRGRRVLGERRVVRFLDRAGAFRWDARGASDGSYLVRFTVRFADGRRAVRRVALLRRRGRFLARPAVQRRDRCGLVRSFKLERPVFGGRTRRALGVSYRLGSRARVAVTLTRRGRVVRRFRTTTRAAGRTYRLRVRARGLRPGDYGVRLVVTRAGGAPKRTALIARRL